MIENKLRKLNEKKSNSNLRSNTQNINNTQISRNVRSFISTLISNYKVEVNVRKSNHRNVYVEDTYPITLFDIYLQTLIGHHLYKDSLNKYKNAIQKQYYLTISQLGNKRIYRGSIENSVTFEEYIRNNCQNPDFITNFCKILKKICTILNYFQIKFGFIHNNLNLENILINRTTLNPTFINLNSSCAELKIKGERKYICIHTPDINYLKINKDERDINNISKSNDLFYLFLNIKNLFGTLNHQNINKLNTKMNNILYTYNGNQNLLEKIKYHIRDILYMKKFSKELINTSSYTKINKDILKQIYSKFEPLNMLKNIINIENEIRRNNSTNTTNNSTTTTNNSKMTNTNNSKMARLRPSFEKRLQNSSFNL